jgi:hypothetical protein
MYDSALFLFRQLNFLRRTRSRPLRVKNREEWRRRKIQRCFCSWLSLGAIVNCSRKPQEDDSSHSTKAHTTATDAPARVTNPADPWDPYVALRSDESDAVCQSLASLSFFPVLRSDSVIAGLSREAQLRPRYVPPLLEELLAVCVGSG